MHASPHPAADQACCSSSLGGAPRLPKPVAWLQGFTIAWMVLECAGALVGAARSHSIALLAFGSDSLVELLSAVVVLLQYLPRFPLRKQHAERAAAVLLFALAASVVLMAGLTFHKPVETSQLGMTITALALVVMPVLAWFKRREAWASGDGALGADAAQSATCAYLAAVTLGGLVANAIWHVAWVDSSAALLAVPLLLAEGRRTWRGEGCDCCG